ncbi:MAG: hypothetical protein ACLPXT_14185 [Terracidiphilus sp.]
MLDFWIRISPLGTFLATLAWFLLGLPAMLAAFYQTWKARQEAKAVREGKLHSMNCLEFVTGDGSCVNLVPLETLHSLPKPGDIVLLPGRGINHDGEFIPGAYLIEGIEHIYAHVAYKGSRPQEARLTKAVAKVTSLNPPLMVEG